MPYGDYAKCPNCGKVAYQEAEIEKEFGYRNISSEKVIPQSWLETTLSEDQCRAL